MHTIVLFFPASLPTLNSFIFIHTPSFLPSFLPPYSLHTWSHPCILLCSLPLCTSTIQHTALKAIQLHSFLHPLSFLCFLLASYIAFSSPRHPCFLSFCTTTVHDTSLIPILMHPFLLLYPLHTLLFSSFHPYPIPCFLSPMHYHYTYRGLLSFTSMPCRISALTVSSQNQI